MGARNRVLKEPAAAGAAGEFVAISVAAAAAEGQDTPASSPEPTPSRSAAFRFWLQLGVVSFGGPAGQIAIMHRELVARRRWIGEAHFLDALNCCTLLPGPEAQQLATYIGWRLHGVRGALTAGTLFVLPSAILLAVLSWIYAEHGQVPAIAAVLDGVRPAVVAIVAAALVRLGRKSLRTALAAAIAVAAFVGLRLLDLPFPLIVIAAAALAALRGADAPATTEGQNADGQPASDSSRHGNSHSRPALVVRTPQDFENGVAPASVLPQHLRRASLVLTTGLALWLAGVAGLSASGHWRGLHGQLYRFFSHTAVVTLGGAYSVLTYVAETMGPGRGWVTPTQTVDGLALAETTPGPLIMVLQFLGYMAGSNHPENGMTPAASGLLGAAVATYATFLPSFVLVLLIAPYVERLRRQARLRAALAGVSAAVLGGIAHLATTFATATFFPGGLAGLDGLPIATTALAVAALALLLRTNLNVAWVVVGAGVAGWVLHTLG